MTRALVVDDALQADFAGLSKWRRRPDRQFAPKRRPSLSRPFQVQYRHFRISLQPAHEETMTPRHLDALRQWLSEDWQKLSVAQFEDLLVALLYYPPNPEFDIDFVVRSNHFQIERLRHALWLGGDGADFSTYLHIRTRHLVHLNNSGAAESELRLLLGDLASEVRRRYRKPSAAPWPDKVACMDLIDAASGFPIEGVLEEVWGTSEVHALLLEHYRALRQAMEHLERLVIRLRPAPIR